MSCSAGASSPSRTRSPTAGSSTCPRAIRRWRYRRMSFSPGRRGIWLRTWRYASNGSDLVNQIFSDVAADATYSGAGYRRDCAMQVINSPAAGHVWFRVCSGVSTSGGEDRPFTEIEQGRWAGEVTCFGHDYYQTWYEDTEYADGCWTRNWNDTETVGTPLPTLGSDYTLQVVLTRDALSSTAVVTVPLQPVNWSSQFPELGEDCFSWDLGASYQYHSGTRCSTEMTSESGVRGEADNQSAQ